MHQILMEHFTDVRDAKNITKGPVTRLTQVSISSKILLAFKRMKIAPLALELAKCVI